MKQKREERQKIQARIDHLSAERDAYIAIESARRAALGKDDAFDAKVRDAVPRAGRHTGITYWSTHLA